MAIRVRINHSFRRDSKVIRCFFYTSVRLSSPVNYIIFIILLFIFPVTFPGYFKVLLTGEVVRNFVAEGNVFIDEENFRVASEGGGMKFLEKVGETSEIEAAYVRPDGLMYLKLEDDSIVPILAALSRREAEYIASEINALVDNESEE